jgi:hypothetical protein
MRTSVVRASLSLLAFVSLAQAQDVGTAYVRPLSKLEREELGWLIRTVDQVARGELPPAPARDWQVHFLRTSDGLAYVPFSIETGASAVPASGALVYVRVATRDSSGPTPEQSALKVWVERPASRLAPPPIKGSAFAGVYRGEMPVGGPALSMGRADTSSIEASATLALIEREKAREREQAEEASRQKRAAEAALKQTRDRRLAGLAVFPFEDFDFSPVLARRPDGVLRVQRALAVPPGEYDVYVAIAGRAPDRKAVGSGTAAVFRQAVSVPAVPPDTLALSSLILAERLVPLDRPHPPEAQASHPYALGWTEIVPAPRAPLASSATLSVVFQVHHPAPTLSGKPDLEAAYRVFRQGPGGERLARTLGAERFNAATLPSNFDLRVGHQVVGMRAVLLASLGAGDYRLEISVTDRVSGRSATADTTFSIVEPAPALLAKAPPLSPPLERGEILGRDTIAMLADAMAASAPPGGLSPQLEAAMGRARAGEFGALLAVAPASSAEIGAATLLRGLALLALNETPAAALALFQSVLDADPGQAAAAFLLGACHGLQGREAEAIRHWEAARRAGLAHPRAAMLLAAAHLRTGRADLALALLDNDPAAVAGADPARAYLRGAALHAVGRDEEAARGLVEHLDRHPGDGRARFLLLRIWFGTFARETGSTGGWPEDRFAREARTYVADANAPHAPLVWEWLKVVERTAAEARGR